MKHVHWIRWKWLVYLAIAAIAVFILFLIALRWATARFLAALGARELERSPENHSLFLSLDRLSRRAQMRSPALYLLEDYSPNAFALRRGKHSMIVLTEGLLQALTQDELEGVFSLCLAQLKLKDFRSSPMATALALPFSSLSRRMPVAISILLQSFASLVVRIFVRPDRMFRADEYAAQILQNPDRIASALRKMASLSRRVPFHGQNIAFDHLFVISAIRDDFLASTCATHPEPEDRIRRLLRVSLAQ